jgi:hypothetical protein
MSAMGVYPDGTTVSEAIEVLHKAGYRATDISVLSSDNRSSKDLAHEKHTKAPAGAATGAAAGAVVAAGPVLAALAGGGAGGALGWMAGLLGGLRLPEYVAKRYAGRIRRGGILPSVHCDSQGWCDRAKRTLEDTGARNISSGSEAAADYGTTAKPTARAPAAVTNRGEAPAQQTIEYAAHETKK